MIIIINGVIGALLNREIDMLVVLVGVMVLQLVLMIATQMIVKTVHILILPN